MNLLAAALYDPSSAVTNKNTTAAIAMTALDTTNLRLTVTAPPSGRLFIRLCCSIHGAATCPQIVLGCLESTTVRGRIAPEITASNLATTTLYRARAEYVLTGLTPGQQYVLDAAYGVETVVASTAIKYGGPNNTTANDNFGAFQFEIWDPSPIYTPSSGAAPTATIADRLPTALVSGRMNCSVGAMAADVVTASAVADGAIDAGAIASGAITNAKFAAGAIDATAIANGAIDAATFASGAIDATAFAQGAADKVWSTSARVLTANTNLGFPSNFGSLAITAGGAVTVGTLPTIPNNWITAAGINASALNGKGDWLLSSGYTAPLDAAGTRSAIGIASANLDTQLGAIKTVADAVLVDTGTTLDGKLDTIDSIVDAILIDTGTTLDGKIDLIGSALVSIDTAIGTRLAADDYEAPDNAGIAAIRAKTDDLEFTEWGLKVDTCYVNGVLIGGEGTAAAPFGPA